MSMRQDSFVSGADKLFSVMTSITAAIARLSKFLDETPKFTGISSGCDVRHFNKKESSDHESYNFEAYVDTKTTSGTPLALRISLARTENEWILMRSVERIEEYGGQSIYDFPVLHFVNIDDCQHNLNQSLDDFVRIARSLLMATAEVTLSE